MDKLIQDKYILGQSNGKTIETDQGLIRLDLNLDLNPNNYTKEVFVNISPKYVN